MAEAACAYDLDQFDGTWLKIINGERALAGAPSISEDQFERVIEELEVNTSPPTTTTNLKAPPNIFLCFH